ncbi:MAG: 16S rRNA (adenine(1518)-N(6)/adenine(1519)-N(6))-dimethyltransferase RsmA, partial [Pseudomonadota bacterium]
MDDVDIPAIRDVIARYDFRAKKSLGQNFLTDRHIADRIVAHAGDITQHHIIEIGPGPGGLTQAILAARPKSLTVIDPDERAIAAMQELAALSTTPMHIHLSDATMIELDNLVPPPRAIIANLPYNVGTKLLNDWLDQAQDFSQMILMFQREVGERITAKSGEKAYSRLSVISNYLCDTELLMTLPPDVFVPKPKVHSTLVHLVPKENPMPPCSLVHLRSVVATCFQKR